MIKVITVCLFFITCVVNAQTKSIREFTDKMEMREGFFSFYYDKESGSVFLQVDKLNQPFLFQSSLPQGVGSNDIGLDRGQLGDTRLVQFQRFGKNLLLKQLNTRFRVSSDNVAEQASIDEAFADSVIAGLPIVAAQDDMLLVDYTSFLLSDVHGVSERLADRKQGNYKVDGNKSGVYLARSKAFENNTELEALVTFTGEGAGEFVRQVSPSKDNISIHLHHSLIQLPDSNYKPRQFQPYSGFWKVGYQDYSVAIDEEIEQKFIPRHRLSKLDPTVAKSKAIEPIVYYLDPGIPEPIRGALLDGAMWWNSAFEKIGYVDAFQVKVLPEDADPMDVRYNVIQWVHRATRGWSYGSSVIDPRTGEIIKGHVTLGSLRVRQDYLIALGLTSPFTTKDAVTDEQIQMALARIRQLSAHEVGHTLGLAHNFAASEDGRESVMDYPHPLLSVVDGKVSLENAYDSGMGEWDLYTIAYGYQDLPTAQNEAAYLDGLMSQARKAGLSYMSDADSRPNHAANANGHLWDNGADPISGMDNIVKVRSAALRNFGVDTLPYGQSFSSLQEKLVPIFYLHRYQLEAVAKLIGGVNYTYEVKGDFEAPIGTTVVEASRQQTAVDMLLDTLEPEFLSIPDRITALINPKVYGDQNSRESFLGRNGLTFDPVSAAEASVGFTLDLLLLPERLNRVATQPAAQNQLTVDSIVNKLFTSTIQKQFKEEHQQLAKRVNYVVLQSVMEAILSDKIAPEVRGVLIQKIITLHDWLKDNKTSNEHVAMAKLLEWYLHTGEWKDILKIKKLPPGSPI